MGVFCSTAERLERGPHYLHRFAVERASTVNIAATGGNAALLTLDEG